MNVWHSGFYCVTLVDDDHVKITPCSWKKDVIITKKKDYKTSCSFYAANLTDHRFPRRYATTMFIGNYCKPFIQEVACLDAAVTGLLELKKKKTDKSFLLPQV